MTLQVYWCQCGDREGNFGDKLTPLLLEYLSVAHEWAPPERANLFGIGSVVESIPERYRGIVWTSGVMHASTTKRLSDARVVAVRGRLTLDRLGGVVPGATALGDGGLLSYLFHRRARKRFKLGIVPHYSDFGDPIVDAVAAASDEIAVIDVCSRPREVIDRIGQCEYILSSSLHGLIVADSLRIPNARIELGDGTRLEGAGFKFDDYYSVYGIRDTERARLQPTDDLDTLLPLLERYARPGLDSVLDGVLVGLRALLDELRVPMWSLGARSLEERETELLTRLKSSHVPRVLDGPEAGERSVERVEGLSLEQARAELTASPQRLHEFFRCCLDLLGALQGRGIAHRAIRRENLLVRAGQPVLIDFSSAISLDARDWLPSRDPADFSAIEVEDVRAFGVLFADLNARRYPRFDPVIALMHERNPRLRVSDLRPLQALFAAAAVAALEDAEGPSASDGIDEFPPVHMQPHVVALTYATLLEQVARRDEELARLRSDLSKLQWGLWQERSQLATSEIESQVAPGETFIFVDDGQLDLRLTANRRALPFLERDGEYWGPPPDDATAIQEVDRLRAAGVSLMVFAWPAFWWLDTFTGLHRHLRATADCILENERLVVFATSRVNKRLGSWRN